jgi:hypothetical protein
MVEEYDENLMLQCDRCRVSVHMDCYGVTQHPDGKLWLCDVCRYPYPPLTHDKP